MKIFLRIILIVSVFAIAASADWPLTQDDSWWPWWNEAWQYRQDIRLKRPDKPSGVARLDFVSGGNIKENAIDLRIFDESGKIVPFKIMDFQPNGITCIFFYYSGDSQKYNQKYSVYYGNPQSNPAVYPEGKWEPKAGVILESRETSKSWHWAANWPDYASMLSASTMKGMTIRPNIFDGVDPFAPFSNHLTVRKGFLNIETRGEYSFSVNADGPVFLFIDGKIVARHPNWHEAPARPNRHGEAVLEPGIHTFEYYQQAQSWPQRAMLAWKKPLENNYAVIPEEVFGQIPAAATVKCEKAVMGWSPYFTWSLSGSVKIESSLVRKVSFQALLNEGHHYQWEFGDGTTGEGPAIDHVYLDFKNTEVTLTESDAEGKKHAELKVIMPAFWDLKTVHGDEAAFKEYFDDVKRYDKALLSVDALLCLAKLADQVRDFTETVRAAEVLTGKKEAGKQAKQDGYLLIGKAFGRDGLADYSKATAAYQSAVEFIDDKDRRNETLLKIADIQLNELSDYDDALKNYQEVLKDSVEEKTRSARAGIGNVFFEKGDIPQAAKYYQEVFAHDKLDYEKEMLLEGDFETRARGYIKIGSADGAVEAIRQWEDKLPWTKLTGTLDLIKGMYFRMIKKPEQAINHFEKAGKVSLSEDVLGEAAFLTAGCYEDLGKNDKAQECYKTIVDRYPISEYYEPAKAKLKN